MVAEPKTQKFLRLKLLNAGDLFVSIRLVIADLSGKWFDF